MSDFTLTPPNPNPSLKGREINRANDLVNSSVQDMQSGLWQYGVDDLAVLQRALKIVMRRGEKTKAAVLRRKIAKTPLSASTQTSPKMEERNLGGDRGKAMNDSKRQVASDRAWFWFRTRCAEAKNLHIHYEILPLNASVRIILLATKQLEEQIALKKVRAR